MENDYLGAEMHSIIDLLQLVQLFHHCLFFFNEPTVTKEVYLDMMQIFAIPQVCHLHPNIFDSKMVCLNIGVKS